MINLFLFPYILVISEQKWKEPQQPPKVDLNQADKYEIEADQNIEEAELPKPPPPPQAPSPKPDFDQGQPEKPDDFGMRDVDKVEE